jgi:hypothetical protein
MIRTQISLDETAYREAKAEARRQGISLAEFPRRAVRLALPPRGRTDRPWMRHAGAVASGDPDASRSVVAETYGWFLHRLGEDAARTFRLALADLPRFSSSP